MIQKKEHVFARGYSDVVREYDFRATLFVTGKCIEQNAPFWKNFLSLDFIEVGAHTYTALQPWFIHKLFYIVARGLGMPPAPRQRAYGPYFYQYLDIKRTLGAFRSIGARPRAWRTHAYAGDSVTYDLLERFGFSTVSDKKSLGDLRITKLGTLVHVPITSIPDEKIGYFYSRGMTQRMMIEGSRVLKFIVDSIQGGKDMVLQLHPICMKLLDDFESFEKILRMLSEHAYVPATITELSSRFQTNVGCICS